MRLHRLGPYVQSSSRTQLTSRPQGPDKRCGLIHTKRHTRTQIRSSESDDQPAAPAELGDWRDFRNKLISQTGGSATDARESEENKLLLKIQNEKLAKEDTWAHSTAVVEQGGVLLATNALPQVLGNEHLWQAAVLLIEHGERGSVGLILNRPTSMKFGKRPGGLPFEVENAPGNLQQVFAENRVYCGGFTAQSVMHVLHGHKLEGAVEVVPGVFVGGEAAAADAVEKKELDSDDFRFFAGAMVWDKGELEAAVKAGSWHTAACSRNLVLKQCLQLPVPLWREILLLMGGKYAQTAEDAYEGDE